MPPRRIPVAQPSLAGNELQYVSSCVETNWISSQGTFVGEFEARFAEFVGARFAVSVSNGTTALHLALAALGIGPGDEVLVPDLTFAATANAVLHCGASPVLVDVDPADWTMDPEAAAAALTDRSRALLPVHLYGQPADMRRLSTVAEESGLAVIEDCAESLGARAFGRVTGTLGKMGCFSFYANKIITTGEGGMVTTDDPELDERLRILRDHGMRSSRRYWHEVLGYNYRMTNMQAAVGLAQMEQLERFIEARARITEAYRVRLGRVEGITLPVVHPWSEPVTWLFSVLLDPAAGSVTRLRERLAEMGIETRPFFHPLHVQPPYQPYREPRSEYPISTRLSESGISLPTYVGLTEEDISFICDAVIDSLG